MLLRLLVDEYQTGRARRVCGHFEDPDDPLECTGGHAGAQVGCGAECIWPDTRVGEERTARISNTLRARFTRPPRRVGMPLEVQRVNRGQRGESQNARCTLKGIAVDADVVTSVEHVVRNVPHTHVRTVNLSHLLFLCPCRRCCGLFKHQPRP